MATEYNEVFMTDFSDAWGSAMYKGNIYLLNEQKAKHLQGEGKALETASVKSYREGRSKIGELIQKLQNEYEEIQKNERLSPAGKREDVENLLEKFRAEAEYLQSEFLHKLEIEEKVERMKLDQAPTNSRINHDEAKTQAGVVKGELAMAGTFADAVAVITDRQSTMDPLVARELLADFATIKREIESQRDFAGARPSASKRVKIVELHESLKRTAYGPEQARAAEKVKLIGAIRQQRGDLISELDMSMRPMKFTHGLRGR